MGRQLHLVNIYFKITVTSQTAVILLINDWLHDWINFG